jgi:DNA topoisomerase I
MAQSLVIVESPAKAKTISKFLGSNFKVQASMGHVRDLPKSQIGVDVESNYEPKYITIRGKGQLITSLKKEAKKSDKIFLATDPDREGEAISWHLSQILGLSQDAPTRIVFHEITKSAIKDAMKHPRTINKDLVDAQQARRILDRLVGYEISPILWRKIKWGLSAGRVQSVVVKLICDREKEIKEFIPSEYWSVIAKLKTTNGVLETKLHSFKNKKIVPETKEQIEDILSSLSNAEFIVKEIKKQERRKSSPNPFITSTLQQESYKKLNFTTKKTMSVAQQLYEGIDIKKEGTVGLITYMRTDSTRISEEAQKNAEKYIVDNFGDNFLPSSKKAVKSKGNIQDAHEAIRPTSVNRHPDIIKDSLTNDQYKLYKLIWSRFIASQMSDAVYDTTSVDVLANNYIFKSTGSILKFQGFLIAYNVEEDEENTKIPNVEIDQVLKLNSLEPKQHFTQPPARFTEASLVKALEENGIGRPSTYAPIISTVIDRGYVVRDKKTLAPTELGEVVTELLKEYFKTIVDTEFTAKMENRLDEIEEGTEEWVHVVDDFYKPLSGLIAIAEDKISKITIEEQVEVTDIPCEKCSKNMVIKKGRFGKFLACPGYPECKNTKPLVEELDVSCPKCSGKVVVRKSKKGRIFYGCNSYPECNYVSWDKPTNEKCPECSTLLIEKNQKGNKVLKCSNKECSYKQVQE